MTNNTLAMTEHGKGDTVVLLHGWGMSSQLFELLSNLLSSNYHIISVDLPGHGASELVCSLTQDEVAEQLLKQVEGRCHWVGWSLGGTLLMHMAQLEPARFKSITLIAATPCFVKQQNWSHGIDANVLNQFSQALTQHPIKTLKRFAALQVLNSPHGNATLKQINELAFTNNMPNQESLQQGLKLLLEQDQRPVLENMQMPMLVILGECDALIPPSIETYYRELLAQPQVHIIDGAGHTPFLSHPDMIAELLDSFLQPLVEKVHAHG